MKNDLMRGGGAGGGGGRGRMKGHLGLKRVWVWVFVCVCTYVFKPKYTCQHSINTELPCKASCPNLYSIEFPRVE